MKYAPIIIPTLNRDEHLKRCIESLKRNEWARETEIYISVDYPPNYQYEKGYKRVCEYLSQSFDEFKTFNVIYQKDNLGSVGNSIFLEKYVEKKYDRYIFLEDDNEVSLNFIEYMDKGLELFASNEKIIAICASTFEGTKKEQFLDNIFLTHNYAAYGVGKWKNKNKIISKTVNEKYLVEICKNAKTLFYLYHEDISLIFQLQDALIKRKNIFWNKFEELQLIDSTIKFFCYLENKYVICPCEAKVINYGYDGSGVNCTQLKTKAEDSFLDNKAHFDYIYSSQFSYRDVRRKYSINEKMRFILAFIKLYYYGMRR